MLDLRVDGVGVTVCEFCGQEAVPGRADVVYSISGWEELRVQGGANMIHLRKRLGPVAHLRCVDEAKPRRRARAEAERPAIVIPERFQSK